MKLGTIQLEDLEFDAVYAWVLVAVLFGAFLSFFFSLQWGVFALLFAAVAWWAWLNPERGFLLFIVLAPILPMLKITQTIGTFTLVKDVLIVALFVRLWLVPLAQRRLPYRRNVLWWPIVALGAWTAVELLRADSLILGVLRARDIGLYALLYLAVLYLDHGPNVWRERLAWFSAGVVTLLGLAVYQWFWAIDSAILRQDPVTGAWIPRLSSVMAHPSIFGEYLVLAVVLFGVLAWKLSVWRWRLLSAALALVGTLAIYLTFSRAVWFGLVAAVGTVAVIAAGVWLYHRGGTAKRQFGKWVITAALVAVIGLGVLVTATPVGVYVRSAFDPTYASNEERLLFLARLVAPMSNREAIVGLGLGDVLSQNFREVDLEVYDIAAGSARAVQLTKNRTLVDNQHLKTFVEMGIVGLVIYGWLYWQFARASVALAAREVKKTRYGVLGLWGIGFLAAFVVQGLFIDIWDIFPTNAAFWIVAAFVSVSLGGEKAQRTKI